MESKLQFQKIVWAHIFGMIGSAVFEFGLAFHILQVTGSSISFAITMIIAPVVSVVLTPFIGYVVDRYDRKRIVTVAQMVSVLTLLIFSLLFGKIENILHLVIPILVSLRMADNFFSAAYLASVRSIVLDDQINRLQSFISALQSGIGIISPIVGAMLYSLLSMPVYILVVAGFEFAALLINVSINFTFQPLRQTEQTTETIGVWQTFSAGFRYIKTRPDLIRFSLIAMLTNFFIKAESVGIPYILVNIFKFSKYRYSLVMAAISIGILVASIVYGLINKDLKRPLFRMYMISMTMGLILAMIGMTIVFTVSSTNAFFSLLALTFLFGIIISLINIPMMGYLQKNIKEEYKGRVFSLFSTMSISLTPIGILLFGVLFNHLSSGSVFIGAGSLLILSVGMLWLNTPNFLLKADGAYTKEEDSKHMDGE